MLFQRASEEARCQAGLPPFERPSIVPIPEPPGLLRRAPTALARRGPAASAGYCVSQCLAQGPKRPNRVNSSPRPLAFTVAPHLTNHNHRVAFTVCRHLIGLASSIKLRERSLKHRPVDRITVENVSVEAPDETSMRILRD